MSPISTFMLFANECSRVRVPFTEHSFSSGAPARWRQNLRNGCRATSTGKSPPLSAITSAPRRWNSSHSYRIVPCHLAVEDVSPFSWRNPELPRQFECKKKIGLKLSLTLFVTIRSHSKSDIKMTITEWLISSPDDAVAKECLKYAF